MSAKIVDGVLVARELQQQVARDVAALKAARV